MSNQNEFVRKANYSLELKHQICKDHVENGLRLRDCVKKYNLSCHSLVHDWQQPKEILSGFSNFKKNTIKSSSYSLP